MPQDNDLAKSHPRSPFRSPDWRWRRATAIAADLRLVSQKLDDPAIRRAATFLNALQRAASPKSHRRIAIDYPELITACQLMQNGGRRQLELESRVLARQAPELIGELMALPLHTVRAYQTFFYDVADRINATGYINNVVLGLNGPTSAPPETWMKALAYNRGPDDIAHFIDFLEHANEIHNLTTAAGRQRESIALFLAVQALDVEARDLAGLQKHAPMIFSQARNPGRYVPVAAVFAGQMLRSLSRLPFRAPDEAKSSVEIPKARGKVAS